MLGFPQHLYLISECESPLTHNFFNLTGESLRCAELPEDEIVSRNYEATVVDAYHHSEHRDGRELELDEKGSKGMLAICR